MIRHLVALRFKIGTAAAKQRLYDDLADLDQRIDDTKPPCP